MIKQSVISHKQHPTPKTKQQAQQTTLTHTSNPTHSTALTTDNIIQLQSLVGNQAVLQLLQDTRQPAAEQSVQREPDAKTPTKTDDKKVDPKVAIKKAAEALMEIKGTADASDKDAVVAEMIKIPLPALIALKKKNIKVVVCRTSVTEVMTELKGVRPRGWPTGKTWDSVPGLFDSANSRVIIATRGGKVPATGDGHGAHNLVLHEVGHAIGDSVEKGGETDPKFIAAREKDKAKLSAYESQAGNAGVEETYAESFARFYGKDPNDATKYPNLHAYWASDPFISG